ncbi:MAG TPA: hypothetical protein VHW96_14725 [Solirubrobacteraceae bacterium]|nr:hypothetical protein [Solirubrobacteraceae bacterium]
MLLAAVAVAVIAAGCGGNSPSSASSSGAAAGAQGGPAAAYQFSACMRSHGVNNFPDPVVKSSADGSSVSIGINPSISGQPAFKTAQAACQHIIGNPRHGSDDNHAQQRVKTEALVAFARCLRAHGFPNFPDPDATGQLSQEAITKAGINFHTPALLTAGKSCASVTHGQITPAQVVAAISHATASTTQASSSP